MEKEERSLRSVLKTVTKKLAPDYVNCKACGRRAVRQVWTDNMNICPFCGRYQAMTADQRLALIFDPGSRQDINSDLSARDPLDFPGYAEKAKRLEKKTGLKESAVTAYGRINGIKVVAAVLDTRFFMGSMSSIVGEKVTRAVEAAGREKLPLIIFAASGGARMQEGIHSLMQMAKTSSAVQEFSENGGLFISYLTHPTTGGVTASFATLGDITLAEPGALIGFAGPRVIEQTIGVKLPKGFQRAEYLHKHGFVDRIVKRHEMKDVLYDILKLHQDSGVFSSYEAGKGGRL
ncbi:MAG: acetyl-CoA carboxylase, carboxyltransferase subunit beta [Lachnospiraceae bacterium]|nr:acetyl-CoA carboxylase, carboxyltransferase subunit beta [Lachnospiraceae bacterium]